MGDTLSLAASDILILEGVLGLLMSLKTSRRVCRVFVETDEEQRKGRMIQDLVTRGIAGPREALAIYESRQIDEAPVVMASKSRADFVVYSG
jgi:uridine kinase